MSNLVQQFLGCHLVRTRRRRTDLQSLFQRSDPNLEELVEIRGRNTQKAKALEKRDIAVTGLFQYALIELEQAEFAVYIQIGRR